MDYRLVLSPIAKAVQRIVHKRRQRISDLVKSPPDIVRAQSLSAALPAGDMPSDALRPDWWYKFRPADDPFPEDLRHAYDLAFSPHYFPAPYRMYAGQHREGLSPTISREDVVVLGDSTVGFSGLCAKLDVLAGPSGPKFLNYGTIAANAGISLSRLLHEIVDTPPKAVIVIGGGMDIAAPIIFDPRPNYPHLHAALEVFFERSFEPSNNSFWHETGDLREHFLARIKDLRDRHGYRSPEWEQRIRTGLVQNVRKTVAICRHFQIPLLYILQPFGYFKSSLSEREAAVLSDRESREYILRQCSSISDDLRSVCDWQRYWATFADFHNLFLNCEEEVYRDLLHTNEYGVQFIATRIHALAQDAGWLDTPGSNN